MSLKATTWEPGGRFGGGRRDFIDGRKRDLDPYSEKVVGFGFDISCVESGGEFEFAVFPKGGGVLDPFETWKLSVVSEGEEEIIQQPVGLEEQERTIRLFVVEIRNRIEMRNKDIGKKHPPPFSRKELFDLLDESFAKFPNIKKRKIEI